MTGDKKTTRADIQGSHAYLSGAQGYGSSPTNDYRRMVIGRDIALKGQISSCDYLILEGELESSSFNAKRLDILEYGLFSGIADVHDCVIAGAFDGKLTVRGILTVKATGEISGNVEYAAMEMEAGATVNAQLSTLKVEVTEATDPVAALEKVEPFNDNLETSQITERGASVFRRAAGN